MKVEQVEHPKKKARVHGEPTEIESLPFTRQKLPTSGVADRNGYTPSRLTENASRAKQRKKMDDRQTHARNSTHEASTQETRMRLTLLQKMPAG